MSAALAAIDLAEVLARIASALRIPVLLLALIALLLCALEVGRFIGEYWRRVRVGREGLRRLVTAVIAEPDHAGTLAEQAPTRIAADALVQIARALGAGEQAGVERALADYELASQRRLERTRILVRAGPALGLMGTLIPLAPGLAALGHGNVATLASDLRTAFAATTVGLLVGTVAFALTTVRTRMYSEDLTALELASAPGSDAAQPAAVDPRTTVPRALAPSQVAYAADGRARAVQAPSAAEEVAP